MYDRILHATDGSDIAEEALEHAIEQATMHDADLHVLHVVPTSQVPPVSTGNVVEQLTEVGEQFVETAANRAQRAGIDDVETVVDSGIVHEEIAREADERDVDMVVMGSRGRSGLQRYLIGSVAESTIREVDVPVLVVETESE